MQLFCREILYFDYFLLLFSLSSNRMLFPYHKTEQLTFESETARIWKVLFC